MISSLALWKLTEEELVLLSFYERKYIRPLTPEPSPYRVRLDAEMLRRGLLVDSDCD